MSQYWSRFKGLLDACPNHRMNEAEIYYLFYEGANPDCKDLMNTSSGGNFTKKKVSEAREILGRLIDAKKAYDQPRFILRRGSASAVQEQGEERVEARIDRLEKALLSAIEKKNSPVSQEKEKSPGPEDNQPHHYYGPPGDGEYQVQVNAMGNWNQNNQNSGWNQWKNMDAPWRDNPCFRWSDGNQPPPSQNPTLVENRQNWPNRSQEGQNHQPSWTGRNQEGQNFQQNWPSRNQEGQNNWGNRNQSNWVNRNQNQPQSNYVPPHQRNQGNQGLHLNQGNSNQGQGSHSGQSYYRQPRSTDDMIGDPLSSQQYYQNNLQANNDLVHKL